MNKQTILLYLYVQTIKTCRTMNKAGLIDNLSKKTNLSKRDIKTVINTYLEIATECMKRDEEIVIIGFGTLSTRHQTSRLARNPKTGVPVMINARKTVKFKPGKYLLESINK